jgi:hypothetical protein
VPFHNISDLQVLRHFIQHSIFQKVTHSASGPDEVCTRVREVAIFYRLSKAGYVVFVDFFGVSQLDCD